MRCQIGRMAKFAFEGSKGGFHFGQLHVLVPECIGVHGIEIGAQEIGALAKLGSPQARFIPRPGELATSMFNRAEHGPTLGITLFESAESALDFARVLEASASDNAAQSAQRAVLTHERVALFERLVQSPIETVFAGHRLSAPQQEIHRRARKPSLVDT